MAFLQRILDRKKTGGKKPGSQKPPAPGSEEKVPLEKGDIPALFMAAVLVLGPYFLILIGVLVLLGIIFRAF
ncbi:MAG: hypothetical protein FWH12_09910 [Treponema sp.]|nr:hypothetical protein [Treponema sp.]